MFVYTFQIALRKIIAFENIEKTDYNYIQLNYSVNLMIAFCSPYNKKMVSFIKL